MVKKILSALFMLNMIIVFLLVDKLNLLTFFLFVVIFPAILFAVFSVCIIRPIGESMSTFIAAVTFVIIILLFSYFRVDNSTLASIEKNTAMLTQNIDGLVVTNISLDFGISSFIMLFLLEFVLIKLFSKVGGNSVYK